MLRTSLQYRMDLPFMTINFQGNFCSQPWQTPGSFWCGSELRSWSVFQPSYIVGSIWKRPLQIWPFQQMWLYDRSLRSLSVFRPYFIVGSIWYRLRTFCSGQWWTLMDFQSGHLSQEAWSSPRTVVTEHNTSTGVFVSLYFNRCCMFLTIYFVSTISGPQVFLFAFGYWFSIHFTIWALVTSGLFCFTFHRLSGTCRRGSYKLSRHWLSFGRFRVFGCGDFTGEHSWILDDLRSPFVDILHYTQTRFLETFR